MSDFMQFLTNYWPFVLIGLFVLLIIIGLAIANFSYDKYISDFQKMREIPTSFGGSALGFGNYLSRVFFGGYIGVKEIDTEELNSNGAYTPSERQVSITSEIANENSIASIGVVAHEFGHALQHKNNPKILINNYKLLLTVKFLGVMNSIFLGLAIYLFAISNLTFGIIALGILFLNFVIALSLKLSTLRLEKDASNKAMELLKATNIFEKKELILIKKFLNSAKKTYTGDFFRALLAWTGLTRKTKLF